MTNQSLYYPQKMGRVILSATEEVTGENGVHTILRLGELSELIDNFPPSTDEMGFSFDSIAKIHNGLDLVYGPRGGMGVALRIGRACFKYGLREYGSLLGLTEMAFRLLPLSTKLTTGAKTFAELFNKYTDQRVRVEITSDKIFWHIDQCPLCWGRRAAEPCCQLAVGLLQESLHWLSGGKTFSVEETRCIGQGHSSCTIEILQKPLS
jgi:predicted hydrocarbon binding protein